MNIHVFTLQKNMIFIVFPSFSSVPFFALICDAFRHRCWLHFSNMLVYIFCFLVSVFLRVFLMFVDRFLIQEWLLNLILGATLCGTSVLFWRPAYRDRRGAPPSAISDAKMEKGCQKDPKWNPKGCQNDAKLLPPHNETEQVLFTVLKVGRRNSRRDNNIEKDIALQMYFFKTCFQMFAHIFVQLSCQMYGYIKGISIHCQLFIFLQMHV